jgi:hypothetical protein
MFVGLESRRAELRRTSKRLIIIAESGGNTNFERLGGWTICQIVLTDCDTAVSFMDSSDGDGRLALFLK